VAEGGGERRSKEPGFEGRPGGSGGRDGGAAGARGVAVGMRGGARGLLNGGRADGKDGAVGVREMSAEGRFGIMDLKAVLEAAGSVGG
jgi:hypothetical protein